MKQLNSLLYRISFIAAFLLPLIFFISLLRGFYFSGDTVSFLQYGTAAAKLRVWDVFLIHGNQWPPLPAMFYNFLQILPGGFNAEQKAYLIIFFFLNLSACYFLVRKYFENFSQKIIITSILLFSGVQTLLLRVSLADVQFMAFWLWALVLLDYFMQTKKEKYAALYIIPASLIPMTRYAGIPVTLTLSAILLIFSFRNFQKGKFSIYFIILAAFFTLLPISLYLFRNLMASHVIFGYYEPQRYEVDRLKVLLDRVTLILQDISLPVLITLIFGTKIAWKKEYFSKIILLLVPLLIYLAVIMKQQFQYRVTEFIPSRYTSPFYPILLLAALLLGSWLAAKFKIIKKIPNIGMLFLTFIFLCTVNYSSLRSFSSELGFLSSARIPETVYSQDLKQFCNFIPGQERFLFLQYDSSNWPAQGLYFFCKPVTWITMTAKEITLPKNSVIFSSYELTEPELIKKDTYYFAHKNIYSYLVKSTIQFNIQKELNKLGSILE